MPDTYKKSEKILNENRDKINENFSYITEPLKALYDCQAKLFKNHISIIIDPYFSLSPDFKIRLQSYFNNAQLLFTAQYLTSLGNHSAATVLLRKIFEFQLLAKYSNENNNSKHIKNWMNERQIDIYKTVIKPLEKPNNTNIFEFWKSLCNPVHATTNNSQVGFEFEENHEAIEMTFIVIFILNINNYHLLNNQLINRKMRYYSEKYGNKKNENKELKELANKAIKFSKEHFISDSGIKLINDYKKKWTFKN